MSEKPNLTEEQQTSFNEILNFINSKSKQLMLLSGFAGTGKTFLSIRLVEHLATNISNRILICAPTNKAVKVLRSEIKELYLNTTFSTIHSALGLKEEIDGFGKIKFVPDRHIKNKVSSCNILIIDEASMLDDKLFYYLISELSNNGRNLKIIFIGDSAQIPPVNKLDSLPFDETIQKKFNIQTTKLSTIIRQGKTHPIIELSDFVRKNLLSENVFSSCKRGKLESEMGSILFLENKQDENRFILLLNDLFASDNFKQDSDFVKIIAWTNSTVENYNDIIRTMIFGDNTAKIMIGEKLILDSPVFENKKIILSTNEEIEVIDYTIRTLNIPGYPAMKYYDSKVELEIEGKKVKYNIKLLHESSEWMYNNYLDKLLKLAKKEKQGSFTAITKWKQFYQFQEVFAKVKYSYALTCHKAQGSTYTNCFIINDDIQKNKNVRERNRLIYTGITRPKENLYILL